MRSKLLVLVAATLPLGGCAGLLGGSAPATLLTLTSAAQVPVGATRTVSPGTAVVVLNPTVPQALAAPRIPVYQGDTEVAYVKDAQWVDYPARLFRGLVVDAIQVRTERSVVDLRQLGPNPATRLSGRLVRFGVEPAAMRAVVTFDADLVRRPNTPLETRRFEATAPMAVVDAPAAAAALNAASNEVAGQIADWVGR